MFIDSISIKNYRCCKNIDISFDNLTSLIGKNGTGKSTILYAINLFFHPENDSQINFNDFFNRDTTNPIEIKITFHKFRNNDLSPELSKIASDNGGKLPIVCRIIWDSISTRALINYEAESLSILEIQNILNSDLNKTEQKKELELLCKSDLRFKDLNVPNRHDDRVQACNDFIIANPSLKQRVTEEVRSLIYSMTKNADTRFVFIPSYLDPNEESVGEQSIINQMVDLFITDVKQNDQFDVILNSANKKIMKMYKTEIEPKMDTLLTQLEDRAKNYIPNIKFHRKELKISPLTKRSPQYGIEIETDGISTDLEYKGSGTKRSIIMSLLEFKSMVEFRQKNTNDCLDSSSDNNLDLIYLIEEPELYMHPSRSRYLYKKFKELTENDSLSQNRAQIMFCTHSSDFVKLEDFPKIRHIKKNISQNFCTHVSFQRFANQWSLITGISMTEITLDSLLAHIKSKTFSRYSEGFFANYIVLVEGESDKEYLIQSMQLQDFDPDEKNIAVIYCDGKLNIQRIYSIFKLFEIPVYVIFDGDIHNKGDSDNEKRTKDSNKSLMDLIGESTHKNTDFPNSAVYDHGTVFQDTIEKFIEIYLEDVKSGLYQALWDKVSKIAGPIRKKNAYYVNLFYQQMLLIIPDGIPFLNEIILKIKQNSENIYSI